MDNCTGLSLRIVSFSMTHIYRAFKQLFGQYKIDFVIWTLFASSLIVFFSKLCQYSVASTENSAFIIGGHIWGESGGLDIVAKFQDNQWTRYGSLNASRRLHASITSDDQTMIIGGDSSAYLR